MDYYGSNFARGWLPYIYTSVTSDGRYVYNLTHGTHSFVLFIQSIITDTCLMDHKPLMYLNERSFS
jgi:hypothetical protein